MLGPILGSHSLGKLPFMGSSLGVYRVCVRIQRLKILIMTSAGRIHIIPGPAIQFLVQGRLHYYVALRTPTKG